MPATRGDRLRWPGQERSETFSCDPEHDQAGVLAALDRFCELYQTGDLREFCKIVNTLLAAMPRIFA